jgi:hypothetical protein
MNYLYVFTLIMYLMSSYIGNSEYSTTPTSVGFNLSVNQKENGFTMRRAICTTGAGTVGLDRSIGNVNAGKLIDDSYCKTVDYDTWECGDSSGEHEIYADDSLLIKSQGIAIKIGQEAKVSNRKVEAVEAGTLILTLLSTPIRSLTAEVVGRM